MLCAQFKVMFRMHWSIVAWKSMNMHHVQGPPLIMKVTKRI